MFLFAVLGLLLSLCICIELLRENVCLKSSASWARMPPLSGVQIMSYASGARSMRMLQDAPAAGPRGQTRDPDQPAGF